MNLAEDTKTSLPNRSNKREMGCQHEHDDE